MADYNAIMTHNPQDFFEGIEPEELSIEMEFDRSEEETAAKVITGILDCVDSGYYVIISKGE